MHQVRNIQLELVLLLFIYSDNHKRMNKEPQELFCPYCGHKKDHVRHTDANSKLVCKNPLCWKIKKLM